MHRSRLSRITPHVPQRWALVAVLAALGACTADPLPDANPGDGSVPGDGGIITPDGDAPTTDASQGGSQDTSLDDFDFGPCSGCKTASGNCLAGDTVEACGTDGDACMACEAGAECQAGECVVPPSCRPGECDGCCTEAGECVAGDADAACGLDGVQCEDCGDGSMCGGGACMPDCSPDTCDGCCTAGGTCVAGTSLEACGVEGASCATCGEDTACSSGECVTLACAESCDGCCTADGECLGGTASDACGAGGGLCASCGGGRICEEAACSLDPDSYWNVRIENAEINRNGTVDSGSWDTFYGLPDPYVQVIVRSEDGEESSGRTATVDNRWEPDFEGELVLRDVPAAWLQNEFRVRVYDDDAASGDDYIGGCYAGLAEGAFGGGLWRWSCERNHRGGQAGILVRFRVESAD